MHGKPYPINPADALTWANQYETATRYLAKINGDKPRKAQYLWVYCNYAKLSPDELINLKLNRDPTHYDDAEKLLDRFATSAYNIPESSRWNICNTVRGFYSRNRHRLEQAGDIEYVPKRTQKKPSKMERFSLYQACYNPRDRALILMSNCSAIALDTLHYLRFDMFEEDWVNCDIPHISIDGAYLKGHGKGKYRGVRQETFLTPEAKRDLIAYREWYSRLFGHVWRSDSHVFLDIRDHIGRGLGYSGIVAVVKDVSKRAGVRFGVHDGRRVLNTALQDVECDPNWIQMAMGRKIVGNKSPYTKPNIEQLRSKYRKALGELEFLGTGFGVANDGLTEEEKLELRRFLKGIKEGKLRVVRADE